MAEVDRDRQRLAVLRRQLGELLEVAQTCDDPDAWACEVELIKRGGDAR